MITSTFLSSCRQQVSDYYLQQAKNLKHEADKEVSDTVLFVLYVP